MTVVSKEMAGNELSERFNFPRQPADEIHGQHLNHQVTQRLRMITLQTDCLLKPLTNHGWKCHYICRFIMTLKLHFCPDEKSENHQSNYSSFSVHHKNLHPKVVEIFQSKPKWFTRKNKISLSGATPVLCQ